MVLLHQENGDLSIQAIKLMIWGLWVYHSIKRKQIRPAIYGDYPPVNIQKAREIHGLVFEEMFYTVIVEFPYVCEYVSLLESK